MKRYNFTIIKERLPLAHVTKLHWYNKLFNKIKQFFNIKPYLTKRRAVKAFINSPAYDLSVLKVGK